MKADNKETFLYMCDDKLFKFQRQILRPWLEKECFGPGFVSISSLSIITQESYLIYLSKLHVIRKYVRHNFFMTRKQNPRKKCNQNKSK